MKNYWTNCTPSRVWGFCGLMGLLWLAPVLAQAQVWMQPPWYVAEPNEPLNFFKAREAFEAYWSQHTIERSKGYKQFRRWENFWEQRVHDDGSFPTGAELWDNWQAYLAQQGLQERGKTASRGGNWVHLGPVNVAANVNNIEQGTGIGRVNAIAFHPTDPNTWYVGAPSGGIWKTTDGGITYETTFDQMPALGVSGIAIHPTNPDIIYIATGDGCTFDTYSLGVLKSTDGGQTWAPTGLGFRVQQGIRMRSIRLHPNDPDVVLVATTVGVFRSPDAGLSWTNVAQGDFRCIRVLPGQPDQWVAAGESIAHSQDGGRTWRTATGVPPQSEVSRIALAVSPATPGVVYAIVGAADHGFHSLLRSQDGGQSFQTLSAAQTGAPNILGWREDGTSQGGQAWYDLDIAAAPTVPNLIYVGGVNMWYSADAGATWTLGHHWQGRGGVQQVHSDQHVYEWKTDSLLFIGNDGGLYRHTVGDTAFADISDGLAITQFYRIGLSAQREDLWLGGTQDNGTFRYRAGWGKVNRGDGMECAVDPANDSTMYSTKQFGILYRSRDGASNWDTISHVIQTTLGDSGVWVTPFLLDPQDPNTIFLGYTQLYKSTDQGDNWTAISSFANFGKLNALSICRTNSNFIYVSSSNGIQRTTNGGQTWTNITAGLPGNVRFRIKYIEVHPDDPNQVWLVSSGYQDGQKVFYSRNGGQDWQNISGSLPNLPANCIVYQRGSQGGIYVGMDVGIFYRDNTLSDWVPFFEGLPNVIINELEIFYPTGKLRAATYGRGIWESQLYAPSPRCMSTAAGQSFNTWNAAYLAQPNLTALSADPAAGTVTLVYANDSTTTTTGTQRNMRYSYRNATGTWQVQQGSVESLNPGTHATALHRGDSLAIVAQDGPNSYLMLTQPLPTGTAQGGASALPGAEAQHRTGIVATPGQYWMADYSAQAGGAGQPGLRIWQGTHNGTNVMWSVAQTFQPSFNTTQTGSPVVGGLSLAWDSAGQRGVLAALTHTTTGTANALSPHIYRTNDGGQTWQGPEIVNLQSSAFGDLRGGYPSGAALTGLDAGLQTAVDPAGRALIILAVGGTLTNDYQPGPFARHLVALRADSAAWHISRLAGLHATEGQIGSSGPTIGHTTHIQLSQSPSRHRLAVLWTDSDTSLSGVQSHTRPDLYLRPYDAQAGQWGEMMAVTQCLTGFEGRAYWPQAARDLLPAPGGWHVPLVLAQLPPSGRADQQITLRYIDDLLLTDCEFRAAPSIQANGPLTFCYGESVTLSLPGGQSGRWSNGSVAPSITVQQSGFYWAEMTASTGCVIRTPTVEVVRNSNEGLFVGPTVGGRTVLCPGESVTLAARFGFTNYTWSDGQTGLSRVVTGPGTFRVTARDANGCELMSEEIIIRAGDVPGTPTITQNGPVLTSSPAAAYQWLRDGQPVAGATQPSFTPTEGGTYRVRVFGLDGCSNESADLSITTRLPDQGPLRSLSLYPNPSQGPITLRGELRQPWQGQLEVLTIAGQVAWDQSVSLPAGAFSLPIDLPAHLSRGRYWLRLHGSGLDAGLRMVRQ